jgi:polyhydroxybutyrate depolymerase
MRRQDAPWSEGANEIVIDNLKRSFQLDLPESWREGVPLVLVFHGYTGSAKVSREESGFSSLAARYGFIAAHPQGTVDARGQTYFNVGYAFHDEKVDDVSFTRKLVARLVSDLKLDARAVFVTGMSNGGDMGYLLGSQPQPFVRAIAPVAGCMMASWERKHIGIARIPVLAVHGTADKVTRWEGDPTNAGGWGAYLGVEETIRSWVNGLSLEAVVTTEITGPSAKNDQVIELRRWSTAKDDAEVRFYKCEGGGHRWPPHLGNAERTTAEEIWRFFEAHCPKTEAAAK